MELLDSLHGGARGQALEGTDWDCSWGAELEARLDGIEAGTVATVPADQVLAKMRASVVPARR